MSSKTTDRKLLKPAAAITALLLLQGLTTALSAPNTSKTVSPGQEVNFTLQASQGQNVQLELLPPKSAGKTFSMKYSNGSYKTTIKPSNFTRKGLYRYRFTSGQENLPENSYLGLTVSSLNQSLENSALNSSDTESESGYCTYKSGDFSCEFEHFQASMILSSAVGLYLNGSEYNREKFANFTFGDYGLSVNVNCDQQENDFNCNSDSITTVDVKSGARQGALINSLWKAYSLTGNATVKDLALNYTRGSAETCDVWSGDFRCSSSRAQALMALGYWEAYEKTGNDTFKGFAEDLTETNYSHPLLASAYLRGSTFSSNDSYLAEAENRTKKWLEDCPNCSSEKFVSLKNALWTGYRVTGDYGYYRNAVNLTSYSNSSFCSWNDNSCANPFVQGLSSLSYWKAYRAQKDMQEAIFNPDIERKTVVGRNLSIDAVMRGRIEDPRVLYRERSGAGDPWKQCDISFFDGCEISGENISKQTPYSYKFKSEKSSFPVNGSLSFAPSLVKENFLDEAKAFTTTDPQSHCAPSEGDFSCEDRALQAPMIRGFSDYNIFNFSASSSNYLSRILGLPYVTGLVFEPLCDVKNGYMSCETGGSAPDDVLQGSVRQARMIESLFSAYNSNNKAGTFERAMNYTLGGAEDCDVWNRTYSQSFTCGSTKGQAEMIEAYLKAYKVTGNETFRKIALNLTEKGLSMNETSRLGSALWEASTYFNESYRNLGIVERAENTSQIFEGFCAGNCSIGEYIGVNKLFRSSYLNSKSDYSTEYRHTILNTTEDGSCGPYKRDVSCSSPAAQGELTSLMWGSAYTMPLQIKVEDSFNLSKDTVTVGKQFSATCSVRNNLENTTLRDTELNLTVSEGLDPVDSNTSYSAGDLEFTNSTSVSWDIQAVSSGARNVSCALSSESGYRDTITQDIRVEEQEQEEEDDSTSSSGESSTPVFGGFVPEDEEGEKRNFSVGYLSRSDLGWNRSFLRELGLNLTYRNFSQNRSCFSAERNIQGSNANLTVSWSCESYEKVVIDPVPENVTADINRSGYSVNVYSNTSAPVKTTYEGLNTTSYSNPLLLTVGYDKPELRLSNVSTSGLDNGTALLSADLSRPAECRVLRGGEEVYFQRTAVLEYEVSPGYGNTTYRVECGDQSFTRMFTRQRPEGSGESGEDMALPLIPLFGILVALFVAAGIYYRERIIEEAEMRLFEYRFSKFQDAVNRGDTAEAIEVFESMSRDVSQQVIESDMDLMQGLLLYLLLDMVQEGKQDDVQFDVSEDLEELVNRYLGDSERSKSARLVEEKYDEVMK